MRPVPVGLLAILVGAPAASASTGPNSIGCTLKRKSFEFAVANAPVLRFAEAETTFPTALLFPILERRYRGQGTAVWHDSSLLAPGADEADRVSWVRLRALYHHDGTASPWTAVLYRVRCLSPSDARALWRFLRADEQAWERSGIGDLWPATRQARTELVVIEYYLYYVEDEGLEGHPHDIESVLAFVPNAPGEGDSLRIVVGSAHSSRDGNNVRVDPGYDPASSLAYSVLVELGGHASSPARAGIKPFTMGLDINWHVPLAWGVRDVQAMSGTGYWGPYRAAYTMEHPGTAEKQPANAQDTTGYRLLPLSLYVGLQREIAERHRDSANALVDLLDRCARPGPSAAKVPPAFDGGAGDACPSAAVPGPAIDLSESELGLIARWFGPMDGDRGRLHLPWKHSLYTGSPRQILKAHLLRPRACCGVGWGAWRVEGLGTGIDVGVTLPAKVPFTHKPLIYLPGFFELHALWGLEPRHTEADGKVVGAGRSLVGLGLLYENLYKDRVSWYVGGDVRTRGGFGVRGGVSVLPWLGQGTGIVRMVRVRAGVRWELRPGGLFDERATVGVPALDLGLVFRQ